MKRRLRVTVDGEEFEVTIEDVNSDSTPRARRTQASPEAAPRPQPRPVPRPEPKPEPKPEPTPEPPEEKKEEAPPAGARGDTEVAAPLAGTIRALTVSVGDKVTKGQTVLTLEALKLENEIVSPVDGTVATVEVSVGQNVDNAQTLITINSS